MPNAGVSTVLWTLSFSIPPGAGRRWQCFLPCLHQFGCCCNSHCQCVHSQMLTTLCPVSSEVQYSSAAMQFTVVWGKSITLCLAVKFNQTIYFFLLFLKYWSLPSLKKNTTQTKNNTKKWFSKIGSVPKHYGIMDVTPNNYWWEWLTVPSFAWQ